MTQRSLERQGFTKEGTLRERWIVGNEISDTAFYGLLQRDWAAQTSSALGGDCELLQGRCKS
jgi:RimJ/RimL family protein N-acetyltransferase